MQVWTGHWLGSGLGARPGSTSGVPEPLVPGLLLNSTGPGENLGSFQTPGGSSDLLAPSCSDSLFVMYTLLALNFGKGKCFLLLQNTGSHRGSSKN